MGRKLIDQIAKKDCPELGKHANPTVVVGMSNSSEFALVPGGFPQAALKDFVANRRRISEIAKAIKCSDLSAIQEEARRLGYDEGLIHVDATAATDAMRDFHMSIIETRGRIVTANKNPISLYNTETYKKLTNDPTRYGYSATAMASMGAIPWIRKRAIIGDKIHQINASLSGTLGFICDRLQSGIPLSEAIAEAKREGFTEPDFRDDLNGLDVARKLVILAREADHTVEMKDVEIEKFLPEEYFGIEDPDECLRQVEAKLDPEMKARFDKLEEQGATLRYLASFKLNGDGQATLKVGFEEVDLDEPFGQLTGTDNRLEVITSIYDPDGPYKIEGPGAGLKHTASGMRMDLVDMQPSVTRKTN